MDNIQAEIENKRKELKKFLDKYNANPYIKSLNIIVIYKNHEEYIKKLKKFGKKVFFCTDTTMRNLGFVDKYLKKLKKENFETLVYDKIIPNPTLNNMLEGINIAKKFNPDLIFALGGGSVIDTAKAISVGIYGDLWDFIEQKKEIKNSIPIVAIATTSGTGSNLTPYAVITNTNTQEKKTLKNLHLLPKLSIADLEIVSFMPKKVIAETGFDVMSHAIEVYTRADCTPLGREASIRALELVKENLIPSYNNRAIRNKLGMIFADIYAGIALAVIGTHLPHAISHPISARFQEISHGKTLALVLSETLKKLKEKNNPELNKKFEFLSKILGGEDNLPETISRYANSLNLDTKPHFTDEDCEQILNDTMGYRMPSVQKSPIILNEEEIREIIFNSLR